MDELFEFVESIPEGPQNSDKLNEALGYIKTREEKLRRFLDDGHIPIDNSRCEAAIRPFAVGRAGWNFFGSEAGAQMVCGIHSLVQTAVMNGANPKIYLQYLLEAGDLRGASPEKLRALTPFSDEYKAYEEEKKLWLFNFRVPESNSKPHYKPTQNKSA